MEGKKITIKRSSAGKFAKKEDITATEQVVVKKPSVLTSSTARKLFQKMAFEARTSNDDSPFEKATIKLFSQAEAGCTHSQKLLLEYCMGKPAIMTEDIEDDQANQSMIVLKNILSVLSKFVTSQQMSEIKEQIVQNS